MGIWTPGPGATAGSDTFTGDGADETADGLGGDDTLNGGDGNDVLSGSEGSDTLTGGNGDDILDGGLNGDIMTGGDGADTYVFDSFSDQIFENANEGIDTVRAFGGVASLWANVENLILDGAAVTGNGNALNNSIIGNIGNNTINGGLGADTMAGGGGSDTYYIDDLGDFVFEDLGAGNDRVYSTVDVTSLWQNVEDLYLTGSAILGTGNALDNDIYGNAENNVLNGGVGIDHMEGGLGNDLYIFNVLEFAVEQTSGGIDTILSYVDIYNLAANVENLTIAGTALIGAGNNLNNIITGNANNNQLAGGIGNDQLNGGAGTDVMNGGSGDDAYLVDNVGDHVVEESIVPNNDIVYSWVTIASLAANVERLTLVGAGNLNGTGNELGNRLNGNSDNNALSGLAGQDVIQGLAGADVLTGGAGRDVLTGGADNDTFVYVDVSESGTTGATRDIINDFTQGADLIDLSAIDADTGAGGDQAFSFIGTAAFTSSAGELRYDQIDNASGDDYTVISMDVNGDGLADSQITLIGLVTLGSADFGP